MAISRMRMQRKLEMIPFFLRTAESLLCVMILCNSEIAKNCILLPRIHAQ